MTLILTELSRHGIAMAADTAVTYRDPTTGSAYAVPNAAKKLRVVPDLHAGISCWGMGKIDDKNTDEWIADFIAARPVTDSLADFATALANRLNAVLPPNTSEDRGRLGMHLCGFELLDEQSMPSFYHIHDGPSQQLSQRGIRVDPLQVNANHDVPPAIAREILSGNNWCITRNGDYRLYASLIVQMEGFFDSLKSEGILIPWSNNLLDRVEYLVFQIRMMSEIYRLSNLVPGIGGGIHYLTITPAGEMSEGIRYY